MARQSIRTGARGVSIATPTRPMGAALVSPAQPALSGDPRPTGDEPPLGGYAALATVFVASIAAVLSALASERRLPKDVSTRDLVLTGVATSRLARVLTRDRVAMPLRAPFAEYTGPGGPGEVHERPRGRGLQRAIGSLLTCPFCAAPWIAAGALVALELRPRVTRFVRGIFVSVTVADFVQQLYVAARTLDGHRR